MDLREVFGDTVYSINIPSARNNPDNKLVLHNYNSIIELSAEQEKQVVTLDEIIDDEENIDRAFALSPIK